MASDRTAPKSGFTLIEVVLATAVFGFAILAVVGLLAPGQRQISNLQDNAIANRLADLIRAEVASYDFNNIGNLVTSNSPPELVANRELTLIRSVKPVTFRVRVGGATYTITGAIPANARLASSNLAAKPPGSLPRNSFSGITRSPSGAPNLNPETTGLLSPGIANRERYFFIRLLPLETPMTPDDTAELAASGSLPLRVVVYYPFQVPEGVTSANKAEAVDEPGADADPAQPDDFGPGAARDINGNASQRAALDAYLATLNQQSFLLSITR